MASPKTRGQSAAQQRLEFGFSRISTLQKQVLLTSSEGILDGRSPSLAAQLSRWL